MGMEILDPNIDNIEKVFIIKNKKIISPVILGPLKIIDKLIETKLIRNKKIFNNSKNVMFINLFK